MAMAMAMVKSYVALLHRGMGCLTKEKAVCASFDSVRCNVTDELTCVGEVHSLDLGQDTDYPEFFRDFPDSF
jgi:hypothetical protein